MKSHLNKITLLSFVASSCIVGGHPPLTDPSLEPQQSMQQGAPLLPQLTQQQPGNTDEASNPEFVPAAPMALPVALQAEVAQDLTHEQNAALQAEGTQDPALEQNPVPDESASSPDSTETAPVERQISDYRRMVVDPTEPLGSEGLFVRKDLLTSKGTIPHEPSPPQSDQACEQTTDESPTEVPEAVESAPQGASQGDGELTSESFTQLPVPSHETDLSRFLDEPSSPLETNTAPSGGDLEEDAAAASVHNEVSSVPRRSLQPIPEDERDEEKAWRLLDDPQPSSPSKRPSGLERRPSKANLFVLSDTPPTESNSDNTESGPTSAGNDPSAPLQTPVQDPTNTQSSIGSHSPATDAGNDQPITDQPTALVAPQHAPVGPSVLQRVARYARWLFTCFGALKINRRQG